MDSWEADEDKASRAPVDATFKLILSETGKMRIEALRALVVVVTPRHRRNVLAELKTLQEKATGDWKMSLERAMSEIQSK